MILFINEKTKQEHEKTKQLKINANIKNEQETTKQLELTNKIN